MKSTLKEKKAQKNTTGVYSTVEFEELDRQYYMPAFSRRLALVRGLGTRVWDAEGHEYLDLVAGIAVCSTGHCHPEVVRAITSQVQRLIHCPNLYYVPNQGNLAKKLVEISGQKKVFFSNSGAEATDAAIKLARVRTGRKKFVAFTHGFHGRTIGSLALTHKPAIREPFEPLGIPCTFAEFGDLDGLRSVVDRDTAGVFVEPIQGEAGVIIPPDGFIEGIRECCDETGALMIADEVQTGMGRTGKWFAYQHTRAVPDIVTFAKGVASGFPMGGILAREGLEFASAEHGSTFAGGPVACAAGIATLKVIEQILPDIRRKGDRFVRGLAGFNPRGRGLMIGITVGEKCPAVQKLCADNGVIVNCAADGNLRLVPPLTILDEEIDQAVGVINGALGTVLL